jgi:hypothetical protein
MSVTTLRKRVDEPDAWSDIVQRLTADKDRQEFAELLHWFRSQPADDEFSKVAKLLGFLTLVGNNLPEALAEEARAIRSLSERIEKANAATDERLSKLPSEIAAGLDPSAIAKEMSHSFRQQLSQTALHETASLMKAAVITLKSLSTELVTTLQPISVTLSEKTTTLLSALKELDEVEQQAAVERGKSNSATVLQAFLFFAVFVVGGVAGYLIHH